MSDEAIQEEFADLDAEQVEDKQETGQEAEKVEPEAAEPEPEISENPEMDAARSAGWVTLDEWTEKGGDPDEWKGYKAFNKDGELYGSLRSTRGELNQLKRTFSESLERNNTFFTAQVKQLKTQKADLERKLDDAVSLADVDGAKELREEIKEVDSTIGEMQAEAAKPVQAEAPLADRLASHPDIGAWVEKNPWIRDESDPRSKEAATMFADRFYQRSPDFTNLDALVEDTINYVNANIKPEKNPNREKAPVTTGGRKTVGSGGKKGLSMADLTPDEKNMWHEFKDVWSEEDFLKTVQESRV